MDKEPEKIYIPSKKVENGKMNSLLQTYHFSLRGITCASCVMHIEKALHKLPNVSKIEINFAQSILIITTTNSPSIIIKAVEDAGYGAELLPGEFLPPEKSSHEFNQLIYQGIIAGGLGLLLFLMDWLGLSPSLNQISGQISWILIGIITLFAMYYCGWEIYRNAWRNLKKRHITMDSLIAISTGVAWLFSMLLSIYPHIVPQEARHLYFEAAIFIICFIDIGRAIELRAKGKTSEAIERLLALRVKTAHVIKDGQEVDIPLEEIVPGDIIKIKPGEKIAVDGTIVGGESSIDEAMLTGESTPIFKKVGDKVIGGTINKSGSFLFKATHVGKDTMLSQIIKLVQEAQNSKPPLARIADQVAAVFVPAVVVVAIITACTWLWFAPVPKINFVLLTSMSVLIIACPCALGLAVPISVVIGIGRAAEAGVLIKSGEALQQISKLTTVVFDKTGTITEGAPEVVAIKVYNGFNEDLVLQFVASLENLSAHPLAEAVIVEAERKKIQLLPVVDFQSYEGKGLVGLINNQRVLLGSTDYLREHGISAIVTETETQVLLAIDNKIAGIISFTDPIRKDAKMAITNLKKLGLKVVMLTGDNYEVAKNVAKQVGIEEFIAKVLPQDKEEKVIALQKQGEIVAMVGDGINDAPALTQAHVGFALGGGIEVAIESADVTLMRNSLQSVVNAIEVAKLTIGNIKQNLFGAFIYNVLCIPIAAGVLYPFFGILLNPVIAAAAMALSDVTVIGNAARLKWLRN